MATKPKRPYATNTKRRSVTITDSDWQALKKLGNGNASAGIREALRNLVSPSPIAYSNQTKTNQYENTTMTRQEAIEAAAALMNGTIAALEALGADNWGRLAELVLDKTGRTDLADAIWEGR